MSLTAPENPKIPAIPNPDARVWHPLTLAAWTHAWESPMASQWLKTDVDALGRLALAWDALYNGVLSALPEIRLQEQRFGLSPLDRSRLQWEVERGDSADRKRQQREEPAKRVSGDPRALLKAVK